MAVDFSASSTYVKPNEPVTLTATGITQGWNYLWTFYDQNDTLVNPTYHSGTNRSSTITISFNTLKRIRCIFLTSLENIIVPDPEFDGQGFPSYIVVNKDDYIYVIAQNYAYSIISSGLDSLILTTTGYVGVDVKITQLNPLTLIEDTLSLTDGTQINGFVTLQRGSLDVNLSFSEGGVYFVYCNYGITEAKHIFVNLKTILEYVDATALENICCSSNSVVNYPSFSQKDYIFNIISNLVHSFLGIELSNIEFNYGELTDYSTLYADKIYECTSVGGLTPSWTLDNILCVETVSGVALNSNSHMIEGNTYRCLSTGVPSSFGGDTISAYITTLDTQLKDMSEIIYKVNQYLIGNDNISC